MRLLIIILFISSGAYSQRVITQSRVIGLKDSFAVRPTVLTNTASLNFPSTASGIAADLTITVTGAEVGDPVVIGVPNGSITSTGQYFGWVSSTNTVTIRFIPHATEDPSSGTFRASVLKHTTILE